MFVRPPKIRVRRAGVRRIKRSAHPWIFRDDVLEAGLAADGDLVDVHSPEDEFLARAFYSKQSRITLRLVSRDDRAVDERFWRERVARALEHREQTVSGTNAARLIFGESDGFPGLVVDRYGDHLVIQTLTSAAERLAPQILNLLEERLSVASVLARNDVSVRRLEGLPKETRQLRGRTPDSIEVREGAIRYRVDPWNGQKTGAFLDQRENRLALARYSRGRVLDVFCYHGSFALHAARSAERVEGIDSSVQAIERAGRNAELNGLANLSFTTDNAFDDLRGRVRRGESHDVIVLDPPAFAKSRGDVAGARRGYKEINLRAMRLLGAGGTLVTCSCSYNLAEADFVDVVAAAARDARKTFRLVESRTQAKDHPVRLGFPESHYLKCLVLSVL